jgi:hypothetical protein
MLGKSSSSFKCRLSERQLKSCKEGDLKAKMQTWDLSNMKERHFLDFIAYNDAAVFKIQ